MRHLKNKGMKLGTDASHTKAMKRSLVNSLFLNDRIKTTETRAKAIRGDVDRVVTWAKRGDLHSRRLALAKLNDKEVVREVFAKAEQGMWADRSCGFTRIIKLGPRKGDNAPMVMMELVTEPCHPKQKKAAEAAPAPVAAPVAEEKAEEAAPAEEAPAKDAE
ncbi:MAG: 50S ribosomal protein L17 [Coriobacteriales bacterium]|nr:50S ribosomal protein L17 [Coriobacteriales bacterium]